jgi:hypothetical protein
MSVNRWAPDSTTGLEKVDLAGLAGLHCIQAYVMECFDVIGDRCAVRSFRDEGTFGNSLMSRVIWRCSCCLLACCLLLSVAMVACSWSRSSNRLFRRDSRVPKSNGRSCNKTIPPSFEWIRRSIALGMWRLVMAGGLKRRTRARIPDQQQIARKRERRRSSSAAHRSPMILIRFERTTTTTTKLTERPQHDDDATTTKKLERQKEQKTFHYVRST